MITRRLDRSPNPLCQSTTACPAIFELDDGNIAIIGTDVTTALKPYLPEGSGCADHERITRVPKTVFLDAIESVMSLP